MNLLQRARRASPAPAASQRFELPKAYEHLSHLYRINQQPINGEFETTAANLNLVAQRVLKQSGPVFSLIAVRQLLLSEARFAWQRLRDGRPGDLFSTADLGLLENPFGGSSTTGDLIARAELDVSLLGNAFIARLDKRPNVLRRLRPDWVTCVWASESDPEDELFGDALDAELIAYLYTPRQPGGQWGQGTVLLPHEVAHWAPYPDPEAYSRGMSWLTPVLREVAADDAALVHKESFFRNGAGPKLAMKIDPAIDEEDFERLVAMIEAQHVGPFNAWKTLYLGGGADPVPMTFNLRDLDYKAVTGAGETRLASAAGVPPTIVGFSEGLEGSSLNAGNYQQTKRRLGDGTLRPLWRNLAGSLGNIFPPPSGSRLWYDDRDIAFLRDDANDAAAITERQASTVRTLVDAGFEPNSAITAAQSGDFSGLKHTGLYSVQLQPPGDGTNPEAGPADKGAPASPTDPGTEPPAPPAEGTKA